jgi:hypothetical protein
MADTSRRRTDGLTSGVPPVSRRRRTRAELDVARDASHYPPALLAREFARLRVAAGLPDRSGVLGAEPCSAEPE